MDGTTAREKVVLRVICSEQSYLQKMVLVKDGPGGGGEIL